MFDDDEPKIIGDWLKQKLLGQGSYGQVTLWQNKITNEKVAIKKCIVVREAITDQDFEKIKDRWQTEIEYMRMASCKYVVRSVQVEPKQFVSTLNERNALGWPLLVMEYCDGGDLRSILNLIENSNGLIESEVRKIITTLRHAVEYLHSLKITHRDLKPENIVIQRRDDTNFYKLTDLGYAKEMIKTSAGSLVGTANYLAPEIYNSSQYSRRIDYWSVGMIVFEIICGMRPFLPHRSLTDYIRNVQKKDFDDIAITENNNGEFIKHQHLFQENQITSCLKTEIESWLRLALDRDAKQRGSEFVKNTVNTSASAPDELQKPPINTLKFFTKLDEILGSKNLTVFCLTTYEFYSYSLINKNRNMIELKNSISIDTGIPSNEIYFILPIREKEMPQITDKTDPNDLYHENEISGSAMVYITRFNHSMNANEPYISEMIHDAQDENRNLKLFYLKELTRKILYFVRNEQHKYEEFLNGLWTYVITMNDVIVKQQTAMTKMNNEVMMLCANVKMHLQVISHSKEILDDKNLLNSCQDFVQKWDQYCDKMEADLTFSELNDRTQKHFKSIYRRSKTMINSQPVKKPDYFNVKTLEKFYEHMRPMKNDGDNTEAAKKFLFRCLTDCLSKRKDFLKMHDIVKLQNDIVSVHVECVKIVENVRNISETISSYEFRIRDQTFKHIKELIEITSENVKAKEDSSNRLTENCQVSQLIQNGESLTVDSNNSQAIIVSCFGESEETTALIEESQQIALAMNDLISDYNKTLMS